MELEHSKAEKAKYKWMLHYNMFGKTCTLKPKGYSVNPVANDHIIYDE